MKKGTSQVMFVEAHFVQKHKMGYKESDEDATAARVEEESQKVNMYERAAKSIGPNIFGLLDMKKSLLLALISGVTNTRTDGLKIRGEIHTLFMGDPGVAKSQLLKQVCNIAPRSVYTTGKGASGVGLTAAVVRDPLTQEVSLEGGALVLADMGVCCIDEFDKMAEGDRTAIHEVMEQQSISIAKAGITTTLNTRTTVLAAANPAFGRYDPYKSPIENMDLPPALLSRFDLVFLLLDTCDTEKDNMLGRHVAKVHGMASQPTTSGPDAAGVATIGAGDVDLLNLGFNPFTADFMRSYIRRAKTYNPVVSDSLQKDIVDAYVSMREEEKRGDIDSRKSYTTPRTLLAILRISQAHARARFSDKVERQDFDEAMRLMKASKESVELSAPAKRGQNPLELVYEIVKDIQSRNKNANGWVELADVISMAGHKAITAEMVREAIDRWEELTIMTWSPDKNMVRFVVPTE
jgi:DNA replication licensing factor MCM7